MNNVTQEFLDNVYHMRQAQKDYNISSKNFAARAKARMYEAKVDDELNRIKGVE